MDKRTFNVEKGQAGRHIIKVIATLVNELWAKEKEFVITISPLTKQRSLSQNASLHKYTTTIAQKMTDAGVSQKKLIGSFKDGFELPVTSHMIKDIFREVGKAMYQKESTADLTTVEISEVYKIVDMRFAEVTGVRAEWPSKNPPIGA